MINRINYAPLAFKGKLWHDTRGKNEETRNNACDFIGDATRDPRIKVYQNNLLYIKNNRPEECKRPDLSSGVIEVDYPDDGTEAFVLIMAKYNDINLQDKKPE